jgi:hypothetical protein
METIAPNPCYQGPALHPAVPAVILSVLSFMLSYSIKEGAAGRALTEATKQVMPVIAEASGIA